MEKRILQRTYRDRPLTPDEAAADEKLREQIAAEFPPAPRIPQTRSSSLSELLKKSIRESGKSTDAIATEAGISSVLLERFLAGERDIHMVTADKLANSLGLEVTVE